MNKLTNYQFLKLLRIFHLNIGPVEDTTRSVFQTRINQLIKISPSMQVTVLKQAEIIHGQPEEDNKETEVDVVYDR